MRVHVFNPASCRDITWYFLSFSSRYRTASTVQYTVLTSSLSRRVLVMSLGTLQAPSVVVHFTFLRFFRDSLFIELYVTSYFPSLRHLIWDSFSTAARPFDIIHFPR